MPPGPLAGSNAVMPAEIAEMMEQRRRVLAAMENAEIEERRRILRFSWLLCRCRPWPDRSTAEPPQAGCVVHGSIMIDVKGRVVG
jgi:hypothetical protein